MVIALPVAAASVNDYVKSITEGYVLIFLSHSVQSLRGS